MDAEQRHHLYDLDVERYGHTAKWNEGLVPVVQPTHVVVDTRDGYVWATGEDGKPMNEATAGRFAVKRNSELPPARQTYRVLKVTVEDPFVVNDSWELDPEGRASLIGRFPSERAAAEHISTLYGHADGRYNLDGPADDW